MSDNFQDIDNRDFLNSKHLKMLTDDHLRIRHIENDLALEVKSLVAQLNDLQREIDNANKDISDTKSLQASYKNENEHIDKEIAKTEEELLFARIALGTTGLGGVFTAILVSPTIRPLVTNIAKRRKIIEDLKIKISALKASKHSFSSIYNLNRKIETLNSAIIASEENIVKIRNQDMPNVELRRTYSTVIDGILNEQARNISFKLAQCAKNCGTDIDRILFVNGTISRQFATASLSRETLKNATDLAYSEKGKFEVPPEELAFRQFVNHVVIPNQDYFEILASKYDDLQKTGRWNFPKLEILKQKPITLSGRRKIGEPECSTNEKLQSEKKAEAAMVAEQRIPVLDLGDMLISGRSVKQNLTKALEKSEAQLDGIREMFESIEIEINDLIKESEDLKRKVAPMEKQFEKDVAKNERVDERTQNMEFDIEVKRATNFKSNVNRLTWATAFSIAGTIGKSVAKRTGQAAVVGAVVGSVVPGAGTAAVGAAAGSVGAVSGFIEGVFEVVRNSSSTVGNTAAGIAATKEEIRLKKEFIENLRQAKIDVDKNRAAINKIWDDINEKAASKEMQELISDSVKSQRILKAFLASTILRDGYNNTLELEQSCENKGINSIDDMLSSFNGRLRNALERFCFGVANSNDIKIIIAEANMLSFKSFNSKEQVLKHFVEDVIKPHAGSFLTRASKVDKIYQTNLLNFGTLFHWEREMVRDSSDLALGALFASEFGMSSVGLQDVRNIYDFYLYRHGDRYLYDTKLKDGQMADDYPEKLVNVIPDEKMDKFIDMVGKSVAHGRSTQPDVGDMFLRVCGYEYFLPQAVKTAGINNIFSENPEAPAAYPMINSVIKDFVNKLNLNSIEKYKTLVGKRLDNLIAQSFIDFFAMLGQIHEKDSALFEHRKRLHDQSISEKYAPTFTSYVMRISKDAVQRFHMFLEIYKQNFERSLELVPEKVRALLEEQIKILPEPARNILSPDVVRPGSLLAKQMAYFENHTFENTSWKGNRLDDFSDTF